MEFTFLNAAGEVAFYRSDQEQADWTQEEMNLLCTFPLNLKKNIERGMTVLFKDPATGDWKAYEIRNVQTFRESGYQQFTAEDIIISELTDQHISDTIELTNITAKEALNNVLPGTGWQVGTVEDAPKSTADIYRGSVWQAVSTIRSNWNVNFLSRVTVDATGITGRYIDIIGTGGTWRGLRLGIEKNCSDPCVTVDDTDLYTALFAYGASYTSGEDVEHQQTVETNIRGVTWSKTSTHPAKPAGQNFLEWPEKTALYGRKGKPRFGYYQNTSIKDPNVLIQKVWETLKTVADPKVSITGTVVDLKRLGYNDEPLRLYDMAIVDLDDVVLYLQIIKLTVNLCDASKNTPTIGSYIPNIIYINRETENYATGGSTGVSGGRGGGGGSRAQKKQGEFETSILQNERNIVLEARQVDENRQKLKAAGIEIDPITGVAIYAEDVVNGLGSVFKVQSQKIESEVTARKNADTQLGTRITQTANAITLEATKRETEDSQLRGQIKVQANKISLVVEERDGRNVVNVAKIVTSINADHGSNILLQADTIDLRGFVRADQLYAQIAAMNDVTMQYVDVTGGIDAVSITGTEGIIDDFQCDQLIFDGYEVSWKSKSIQNLNLGATHNFVYKSGSTEYTSSGRIVIDSATDTIYYLGR